MTVTLSGNGPTVTLHHTQEDTIDTEANIITVSLFSSSPGDTFLLPLTASDEGRPQGLATSNATGGYGGLAQWVADLESHADGSMQSEVTLSSDQRGRSVNGQLRSVAWEVEGGAPDEVQWSLEFVRGRGLPFDFDFGTGSSGPESTSPSSSASLAGYDLGEIQQYRVNREQDITEFNIPQFVDDIDLDDNFAFSVGGVTRTFNISGRKVGSEGALNSFENAMQDRMGDLINTSTYNEAFPGRTLDVAIQQFRSDRLAGRPDELEYSLELIEGRQFGDLEDIIDDLL